MLTSAKLSETDPTFVIHKFMDSRVDWPKVRLYNYVSIFICSF